MPQTRPPARLAATARSGGFSSFTALRAPRDQAPRAQESVQLRANRHEPGVADTGDGVLATRHFGVGETVMVGFLIGALSGNDSHATQVGPSSWARHGGLGPKVNHSCDPNCGVHLNQNSAFDFVARREIAEGQELTFDYAMRNYTIDHFPSNCLCGAANCRGSVTGWKDLPEDRKGAYGELVAPYLRAMDESARARKRSGMQPTLSQRIGL